MKVRAFVFVSLSLLLAGGLAAASPGRGRPQRSALHRVEMHDLTALEKGILTQLGWTGLGHDCNALGYVVAQREKIKLKDRTLYILDGTGRQVILDLFNTEIEWSRLFPDPLSGALSGDFDGCFGGSDNSHLRVFIDVPRGKKPTFIRFQWDFAFYINEENGIDEHFRLTSDWIEIQEWDPDLSVINLIAATFDVAYYREGGGVVWANYESLTQGEGVYLEFYMHTAPEKSP